MSDDKPDKGSGARVRDDDLFRVGILDLATGLVNAVDGSGDGGTWEEIDATAAYLERRLAEWRPSVTPPSRARDAAARSYVEASLAEFYARRGA